jgi:hypothetical protein
LYNKNQPSQDKKNRLNDELVHRYGPVRQISNKALEEFAIEECNKNGKGITIKDLMQKFCIPKKKSST